MTPDVAQLGSLKEFDIIDFDNYSDGGGKNYAPPEPGRYYGQVPLITDANFGSTNAGYLKFKLDPITIVNSPEGNGYQIKFTSLSAKKYSNREGSQIMDFLRACGVAARPSSNAELMALLKSTSGKIFQFELTWRGYDKATDTEFKLDDFQIDDVTGKRQTLLEEPINKAKVYANGTVRYFVSAVKK